MTRRTAHTFEIADHLWEALEAMAVEMDADPQVLVSQALFNFARVNGYFVPGTVARVGAERAVAPPLPPIALQPLPQVTALPPPPVATAPAPGGPPASPPLPDLTMRPMPAYAPPAAKAEKPADPDADPARIAQAARIAEIQADIDRLTVPVPDGDLLAEEEDDEEIEAEEDEDEAEDEREEAEDEDEADDEDEEDTLAEPATEDRVPVQPDEAESAEEHDARDDRTLIGVTLTRKLFVTIDDEPPMEITVDRFVIGRDAKCDLVVPSDKLSRQHAAVVRDATGAEIEDLGSSNGTWFNEERISKRDIEDGDEFMLGNVKLRFEFKS